jgi:hypothetical protein
MNFAGDVVVLAHWLGLFAGNAILSIAILVGYMDQVMLLQRHLD